MNLTVPLEPGNGMAPPAEIIGSLKLEDSNNPVQRLFEADKAQCKGTNHGSLTVQSKKESDFILRASPVFGSRLLVFCSN